MTWIIDAHQDIVYESLLHGRDYKLPIPDNRARESHETEAQLTLGWHEYHQANIGLIFATLFQERMKSAIGDPRIGLEFRTGDDFHRSAVRQFDFYQRWHEDEDGKFTLIRTADELARLVALRAGKNGDVATTPAIGLVLLMEGCEGLRSFGDLDEYVERGLRLVGPVWSGGRWCGGMDSDPRDGFTPDGIDLLGELNERRIILDISHMNRKSANQALERYEGTVVATHCNCIALLPGAENERLLADDTIRLLIERDGVMGVVPCNAFLDLHWKIGDDRSRVTLDTLINHIDRVCQMAGSANHVAIGTDLDGGFGYPAIPAEMNHIGDLGKIVGALSERGFADEDIEKICHGNWLRILKKNLC